MHHAHRRGFTLVETLVGTALFILVSMAVYQSYITVINLVQLSRYKGTAILLANEQFEILRNLPYNDVGEVNGIPVGKFPHVQTFVRDAATFTATTTIRNVDDPFDGTIGHVPNDLSPADYRIAEVEVGCATCKNFTPIILTARISPKNLETASTNGALFVKVIDANGQPVNDANIHIVGTGTSTVVIDDVTGPDGMLQIVDVPPGNELYQITVSKTGYSTDRTYTRGGSTPNPVKPNVTVLVQQVTQVTFVIDRVSMMNITAVTDTCDAISPLAFNLKGTKLISTPSTLKYDNDFTLSGATKQISNLEWDTYTLALTDAQYDLEGIIPLMPVSVAPNATQDVKLIVKEKNPAELMVTVKDNNSGLPITGAEVTLTGADSLSTGQGYLRQTDWSGGGGQSDFGAQNKYASSDGNIDTTTVPGQMRLKNIFGEYVSSGTLTSSTFDTGTTSNFYQITSLPQSQPPAVGANSVRIQVATNNDNSTWNFKGPDGTASTYYSPSATNIWTGNNGNQYLRYKMFLQSAATSSTPTVSDLSFTYSSDCAPPGQVFFENLSPGTYPISVSATGYQTYSGSVSVGSSWTQFSVSLVQ